MFDIFDPSIFTLKIRSNDLFVLNATKLLIEALTIKTLTDVIQLDLIA